jgi:FKBP-type peptidyl-prolyl cis-trans isomerase 2
MKKTVNGDNVILEYEGMLQDGEIVESSADSGPFEYKVGSGLMPPGFENALIGMEEGEEKAVTLQPDEAFGPWDDKLLHTMNKSSFGETIRPKPGMVLGMTVSKEGQQQKIPALVTAVKGDAVTIDFNHPLAGKTIIYKLILKKIK